MKKVLIYALYLVAVLGMISCEKEEDQAAGVSSTLKITVKNASGVVQPGVPVYLFAVQATDANGTNPAQALKNVVTNQSGIATFNVQNLAAFQSGGTLYATAMEKLVSKEFNLLGSVDVANTKMATIEKDLEISERRLKYNYGFLPTTITTDLAISEYERWKSTQLQACGDAIGVVNNEGKFLVEAIGFGTLLSAYAKDRPTFDGLIRFYKSKRTPESNGMMGWKVTCAGIDDPGSATDGDVDVAFALIVASKQWNEPSYLQDAKDILAIVKRDVFFQCTVNNRTVLVLGPGYSGRAWGGCQEMDIMYHTPAFFRVFAEITGDAVWATLADDTYTTLNAGANPITGLVPDWQSASGGPSTATYRVHHFGYDACRAPWRLTLDYLWNGNQKSKDWATKISGWANGVGPANIVDGYELNGTPRGQYRGNSAFIGGFGVAAMANSQTVANSFGTEMGKLNDNYWFNINTRVLYLFTMTGNFWNPLDR